MPTQRPPSVTTGTPCTSCSDRTASTCSTGSSGRTVAGAGSMMSRTVSGTGDERTGSGPQRPRQSRDDVGGDHVLVALLEPRQAAGAPVRVDRRADRVLRIGAPREQRADHSREDVAGAGGGQPGSAAGA